MQTVCRLSVVALLVGLFAGPSKADLSDFANYNLGGTTASWDFFTGSARQASYAYATGTPGTTINSPTNQTLNIVNPGHVEVSTFTKMSGPTDAGETFYTFFAASVRFSVDAVASGVIDTLVLQGKALPASAGGLTNATLNGLAATSTGTGANGVQFWKWDNLSLAAGSGYSVAWQANVQHSAFDAFQIQSGVSAVPEPTSLALMGVAGVAGYVARRLS